jgi:arylsulfatase A-like enzyme
MGERQGVRTVGGGLAVGLAWGLLAALLEGLPLLLQGSPWAYPGERLLALAYLAVLYGLLGALAGALLGTALWLMARFAPVDVGHPAPKIAGLLAAATAAILSLQRFGTGPAAWAGSLLLAGGAGTVVAWLLDRAAREGARPRRALRVLGPAIFGVALVALLAVAGYRARLRELPAFNPPRTGETASAERPNIVLITAGGIRPDHLGAYGYGAGGEPEISPNLDALARRGTRFEVALAQASWDEPSLASLLTSLYPTELGIECRAAIHCRPQLDAERLTLAEALQRAGYGTQAYVTSSWLTPGLGFDQGFDGFEGVRDAQPFDVAQLLDGTLGRLLGCRRDSALCQRAMDGYARLFEAAIPPGWGGDHVNARVGRFLELHGRERFFLWVHYTEALPPYDLEDPFRPIAREPLASRARHLRGLGYWQLGDPFTAREDLLPLDAEGLQALYDGEVHRIDRLVGGVTGLLEGYGLADRTVVVFTSDHGQEFMEHGGYTYGHSLYDEVLRVPLIVAGPGTSTPGQVITTPVGLVDLAPTLLALAGAAIPAEAEGRSLVPALSGEGLEPRPVYSESLYRVPQELKAVRAEGYKLILNADDGSAELYDLRADPAEQRDISLEAAAVGETLRGYVLDWMAHTRQVAGELPRAAPPAEFRDVAW